MKNRVVSGLLLTLTLGTGFIAGHVSAAQPHMQAALENLRAARRELDRASEDKGGHRARAIALVNDAVVQVEEGMRFDRRH